MNPRKGVASASINEYREVITLTYQFIGLSRSSDTLTSVASAKRWYAREVQSARYGFEKPIWRKDN
jgi:hypothetical protein